MPLAAKQAVALEACIKDFLSDHIAMPFGILREYGAVSDLRQRLLLKAFTHPVSADIAGHPWNRTGVRTDVLRVQQEIKVGLSTGWLLSGFSTLSASETAAWAPAKPATASLDIAILAQAPQLTCASNGPGDVLSSVNAGSIDAAIEVKASPSVASDMKGEYVKDIRALLDLARLHRIDGYFVLLDKSLGLYGTPAPALAMGWNTTQPQDIVFRAKGKPTIKRGCLIDAGVSISTKAPAQPSVQVWTIAAGAKGRWMPARYYAY